ncbi:peroxiredoxin-like family protein [Ferrimonas marina]|uniref:Peroxiredoxin n=1 Tax=Ferrimonas marina TaxID=299255 RepID=A0A1M5MRU3_9GAMM|nr:peroxiredoxin-like family protein [Ferrimonas marina]SHG80011.1 Peroxiredoxin [Ferrimonas marina]
MYTNNKLRAGGIFPPLTVTGRDGEELTLGVPRGHLEWQMVVVYRGRHCPLCTKYLNALEGHLADLAGIGVDVIAVSADSKDQLEEHMTRLEISFPIAYGLTEGNMKTLGVYISEPRSEQETDHRFAEPGLFVVNQDGRLHVTDISNNPFVRPELSQLVSGLAWIRDPENHYPIRGTFWDAPDDT